MAIKSSDLPNRLAMDVRSSQDLREKFKQDPQAGLKAAAQQFEAMFLQMVMKSMRDATPQDGMFNSDQTRFYTSMLDQQMAMNMASGKGLGFAKMIEQQLGRNMAAATDGAAKEAATGAADAVETGKAAIRAGDLLPLAAPAGRHLAGLLATKTLPVQVGDAVQGREFAGAAGDAGGASSKAFVNQVWPYAVEASRQTGIPPQFLVAHAALESGWGKSEIKRGDGSSSFNLFGIKAGKSWNGQTVAAATTEYVNGEAQKTTEKFRAYGSYAESFRDYANLLRNNQRFGGVIGSQDGTEFARRLQQAGYATDPAYADKLSRIINGPTLRQALIG